MIIVLIRLCIDTPRVKNTTVLLVCRLYLIFYFFSHIFDFNVLLKISMWNLFHLLFIPFHVYSINKCTNIVTISIFLKILIEIHIYVCIYSIDIDFIRITYPIFQSKSYPYPGLEAILIIHQISYSKRHERKKYLKLCDEIDSQFLWWDRWFLGLIIVGCFLFACLT